MTSEFWQRQQDYPLAKRQDVLDVNDYYNDDDNNNDNNNNRNNNNNIDNVDCANIQKTKLDSFYKQVFYNLRLKSQKI